MMRGVSVVVATVILIAITVVAAIAVWFWVGAMGKPGQPQEIKAFIVEQCVVGTNTTQLRLYNNGALTIAIRTDSRILSANLDTVVENVTVPTMKPAQRDTTTVGVALTKGTSYYVEYKSIPLVKFGC